jgi:Flp pilus assembly protein TadD
MLKRQTDIPHKFNKIEFWLQIAIFLFPFIIYSNTIGHGYALDDAMVITHNHYTKQGFAGLKYIFSNDSFKGFFQEKAVYLPGGRYRPLSIATFAVEYEIFGLNPHISHLINILVYAFTGLILFRLLKLMLTEKKLSLSWLTLHALSAFIFLAHPVHTEAVTNIKGRDELLTLMFALITLSAVIKYIDTNNWYWLIVSFITFILALLSKENAVVYIVLAPLTVYFFRKPTFRQLMLSSLPLLVATFIIIIIRYKITQGFKVQASDDLMNNPFLHADLSQKYSTIVLTLGIYLKLLFWPHPLTFDYYPYHIALTNWHNPLVIFSFLLYMLLFFYVFIKFRQKTIEAYAILFFTICLLPVSNLFINTGTFMNERFIYQSSIGFAIAISFILTHWLKRVKNEFVRKYITVSIVAFIVAGFSAMTFARNYAWKNDFTLFLTDVKTSSNSAKSNYAAGAILVDSALNITNLNEKNRFLIQAIEYLTKASSIDSTFSDAWRRLGTAYYELSHNVPQAFQFYYKAIRNNIGDEAAYNHIYYILSQYDSTDHKISMYQELLKINPRRPEIYAKLGMIYGREKNDYASAVKYYKMAIAVNSSYLEAYKGLGLSFALSGNYKEAFDWMEKAMKINPSDAGIYKIMGYIAKKKGDMEQAKYYYLKASQLENK